MTMLSLAVHSTRAASAVNEL